MAALAKRRLGYGVDYARRGISFGAGLHRRVIDSLGEGLDGQTDRQEGIQQLRVFAHLVQKSCGEQRLVLIRDLHGLLDKPHRLIAELWHADAILDVEIDQKRELLTKGFDRCGSV